MNIESKIKDQIKLINDIENDIIKLKRFKNDAEKILNELVLESVKQLKINFDEDTE